MSNKTKSEFGLCRDCKNWSSQNTKWLEEYPRDKPADEGYIDGVCGRIKKGITITASGGWEGATVDSVETDANFGCVYFTRKTIETEILPCFDCGKTATWLYMPSSELPEAQRWACDEHVPRGCSCNEEPLDGDFENGDPANWKQATDSQGRKVPCCEWWPLHDDSSLPNAR